MNEKIRLSKLLSQKGICSRREADELIARGWIVVDGEVIRELGTKVDPGALVSLTPEARRFLRGKATILLNKPIGYVSGQAEHGYKPAVVLITAENHDPKDANRSFDRKHLQGLAPAGRLDIDSKGLLVLTQDGALARRLIGADSEIEKEYIVRVEGARSNEAVEKLRFGLELDGRQLKRAQVEWINEDQLRFVLKEGRKRQIRRMCELVGLKVTGLKRVRIGGVRLGPLPEGKWRYLRDDETF